MTRSETLLRNLGGALALADGVEDGLHAVGDTEFVKDAEEVVFDGMLAELERGGELAIAESVGEEVKDLLFALAEERVAEDVGDFEGARKGERTQEKVKLRGVGPDLTIGDTADAFKEQGNIRA